MGCGVKKNTHARRAQRCRHGRTSCPFYAQSEDNTDKKGFTPQRDYATSEEKHQGAAMLKSVRPIPLAATAVCLAGLLFCLWVFFTGGKSLCLTDGCSLFQDFRLAGISLWQAGAVLFAALLALALLRLSRPAYLLAGLALTADAVLLCIMLFTAPCVNCLIVGSLIALAYLAFRDAVLPVQRDRSALVMVWTVLLIADLGSVLRDFADPWSPLPGEHASVQVYFSPSCRACQTLISHADDLNNARWYPVPEDTRDIWVIAAMEERLSRGLSLEQAVEEARRVVPEAEAFDNDAGYRLGLLKPGMLLLQFRLWRNHAHVLAAGSDRLPFVEFMGLPSFLAEPVAQPRSDLSDAHETPDIPGLNVAGFCDGESETPCEEPPAPLTEGNLIDTSGMVP